MPKKPYKVKVKRVPNAEPQEAYRKRKLKPETTLVEWKKKVNAAHPKADFVHTTARLIKRGGYSIEVNVPALARRMGRTMAWACLGPPISKTIGYWSSITDWE